jgi:membrane associated rhomboid family serine protease
VSSSVPSTGSTPVRAGAATLGRSIAVMGGLLALLWGMEFFDSLIGGRLDYYGIHAQDVDGLPGILSAPLLHGGWGHLIGNSVPFFVLGLLVLLGGLARWIWSTAISILASGLTAWLLTPAGTVIIGASGLIFGWLTYLLARGLWSRKLGQVVIAAAVLLFYGGMIVGILPGAAGVSWQAHLGGAIGGIFAAWLLHRRR